MAEICKTAEVPKGSFYYFFEPKEALALAIIDEQWAAEKRDCGEGILRGDAQPLEPVEAALRGHPEPPAGRPGQLRSGLRVHVRQSLFGDEQSDGRRT
ncbi:TetR/AcrR family transcriptional regulator [Streptomyces sp. NPDC056628]|uniref:TetR/AcrR family transcriptional regulator n=1 Tax=Streptomyces sp. NPDC056628 TaxID=3345882 RepID=UPI00368EDC6B